MGAGFNHSSQGRSRRRRRPAPIGEINITPMVDVMLVLLIVFMVAAPLMTSSIPVDLPKIKAKALESKIEPVVVTVNKEGLLYFKDQEITLDHLLQQLHGSLTSDPEMRVFLRGDKELSYGAVMTVMGKLNAGGITKVALVVEHPQGKETTSFNPPAAKAQKPLSPAGSAVKKLSH